MRAYLPLLVLLAGLLPFLSIEALMSVNGDTAWLVTAAGRLLDGGRMAQAFFDTNPPMSFLIYIPAALLVKAGMPLWHAAFIYTVFILGLSLFLVICLLREDRERDPAQAWGMIAVFAACLVFPARHEWGQKDQLLAALLLPFLLAQINLTLRPGATPVATRLALLLGLPFILMKPHYGFLTVLLLIHRYMCRRSEASPVILREPQATEESPGRSFAALRMTGRVFKDFDFVVLAGGVVLYAVLITLRFSDFPAEILRWSLLFYVTEPMSQVFVAVGGLGLLAVCSLVLGQCSGAPAEQRTSALFFNAMALASVGPLLAQLKGFSVHMLPPVSLLGPAVFMTLSLYMKLPRQPMWLMLAALALGYILFPLNLSYPAHRDYPATLLAHTIKSNAQGSSFLMQSESTNIIYPASVYTGVPVASRFPSLWFMSGMKDNDRARAVFSAYVAEDLDRFRPALVMIYADPPPAFDFRALLGGHAAFDNAWAHYRKSGQMLLEPQDYMTGTREALKAPIVYDIYVRAP